MSFSLFEDETPVTDDSKLEVEHPPARVSEVGDGLPVQELKMLVEVEANQEAEKLTLPEYVAAGYASGLADAIAASTEITNLARQHFGRGFTPFEEFVRRIPDTNSMNKMVFEQIFATAKTTGLAAPGDYSISRNDFDEFLTGLNHHGGYRENDNVKVDILGLCSAIHTAYGGDKGNLVEDKRVADELIRTFGLKEHEIQPKAGFVVLAQRMYLEKKYGGGYQLNYTYENTLRNTMKNLSHVFEQQSMDFDLNELVVFLSDYRERVEPNKTTFVGSVDDQPLSVKVMKEEFRWKFTEACIAVISDFVAEYGSAD